MKLFDVCLDNDPTSQLLQPVFRPSVGRPRFSGCANVNNWHRAAVVALLTALAAILAWIDWRTSPNRTEVGHMAAGLYTWHTFCFDVFHTNPPLMRAVATAPVAASSPKTDWSPYSSAPLDRCEWALGNAFIEANDINDVRWYFALARWACIPLSLLGGYITYRFSQEIFGKASGLCALTLWCFSPMLLAWGATICPDVAAASLSIAAVYAFWHWLRDPCWDRAVIAGLVLGLAELTKFTLAVFYPLWPLMWFLYRLPELRELSYRRWRSEAVQLLSALMLSVLAINAGYGFDGSFRPLGEYQFQSHTLSGKKPAENSSADGANRFVGTWLEKLPMPLPANMVQGIDTQRYDFEQGLPSYLRGQWADHGWWHYYLYALGLKEPLGTWCLAILAIGISILGRGFSAPCRDEMIMLLPGLVILFFVSSQTGFSVHPRYVIPALPFLFAWTSKVARVFEMQPSIRIRLAMAATVIFALFWSVAGSLASCPHSLSYFNELAIVLPTSADASYPKPIGENDKKESYWSRIRYALTAGSWDGPRHLLDSNIDWGQDLSYLKDWLEEHQDVKLDGFACDGLSPIKLAGLSETLLPPPGPQSNAASENRIETNQIGPKPGWYALSVNYIFSRDQQYRYFLHFEPSATAGYSIYIYHVTLDEANRVREELGLSRLQQKEKTIETALIME